MNKTVLVISASDPSGSTGVQVDIKTLADIGVEGVSAITAITSREDDEVVAVHPTPADVLTQQLSCACKGRDISAIKIGLVATKANARVITWFLRQFGGTAVVIDPILHSLTGEALLEARAFPYLAKQLLPLASLITPNLSEATALAGMQVGSRETMEKAAKVVHDDAIKLRGGLQRPLAVIVRGSSEGGGMDVLYDGEKFYQYQAIGVKGKMPKGMGCRFASAAAGHLAKGAALLDAVLGAREYLKAFVEGGR